MPTTPHVAPPTVMAKIIQIGESPVESPRIFGPRMVPSNYCSRKIRIRKIKACFGEMINKMISPGIAPINGPKYGIILVMPTMILISSAYCRCRMHMSTKQIMPMISESSALPMIY